MNEKRRITTVHVPNLSSSPISAARVFERVVYTSGQVGRDPKTGQVPVDFTRQVHLAMGNLSRTLEAAGSSLANVLKTTVVLTSREDFESMNRLYEQYFPSDKPARSTIITDLARSELRFEIEAIAASDA